MYGCYRTWVGRLQRGTRTARNRQLALCRRDCRSKAYARGYVENGTHRFGRTVARRLGTALYADPLQHGRKSRRNGHRIAQHGRRFVALFDRHLCQFRCSRLEPRRQRNMVSLQSQRLHADMGDESQRLRTASNLRCGGRRGEHTSTSRI